MILLARYTGHTSTYCNTLQSTATHYKALQHDLCVHVIRDSFNSIPSLYAANILADTYTYIYTSICIYIVIRDSFNSIPSVYAANIFADTYIYIYTSIYIYRNTRLIQHNSISIRRKHTCGYIYIYPYIYIYIP